MSSEPDYEAIITCDRKFIGERMAVKLAYEQSLEGFYDECVGSVHEFGYYCQVTLPNNSVVYFWEDSQGFVSEITATAFQSAIEAYCLWNEQE